LIVAHHSAIFDSILIILKFVIFAVGCVFSTNHISLYFGIYFLLFGILYGRVPAGRAIHSNLFCKRQKRISAAIPHATWFIKAFAVEE